MRPGLLTSLLLALTLVAPLSAQDLDALRRDYAMHYFDAATHMALARALRDRGDRLTAFFILEEARRQHFEEAEFNAAFARDFLGDRFDNSKEAESGIQLQLTKRPGDLELMHKLADIYVSRSEWDRAIPLVQQEAASTPESVGPVNVLSEIQHRKGDDASAAKLLADYVVAHPDTVDGYAMRIDAANKKKDPAVPALIKEALKKYPEDGVLHFDAAIAAHDDVATAASEYRRAAELSPASAFIQGWTGRYFLKSVKDDRQALKYYLNAYFLDPDFYDSEFAEGRIRGLSAKLASLKIAQYGSQPGHRMRDLLGDPDPVVVSQVLEGLDSHWEKAMAPDVLALLRRDDAGLRMEATTVLTNHYDPSMDAEVEKLLASPDLRLQGTAAYLAVKRWGPPKVLPLLASPAELVRYDTLSALNLLGGPEGQAAFAAYVSSGKEPSEKMRALLKRSQEPEKEEKPLPLQEQENR